MNVQSKAIKCINEVTIIACVHNVGIDLNGLPPVIYKTVLRSGNTIRSKTAVIK